MSAAVRVHAAAETVLSAVIPIDGRLRVVIGIGALMRLGVVTVRMSSRNGVRIPVRSREQPEDQGQDGRYDHERAQHRKASSFGGSVAEARRPRL